MRIVLLTRTDRPSGATVAKEIIRSGKNLVGIVAERRGGLIKGKGSILFASFKILKHHGVKFILSKLFELISIKFHFIFHLLFLNKKDPGERNYYSIKELILDYPVPFFLLNNHNGSECKNLLSELKPDIIVVTNTRVVSKEIIAISRFGCLNLHLGRLPQYAGLASIFWALYNGEKEIGVTIHFLEEKLDAGDIALQKTIDVLPEDSEGTLYRKALNLGAKMMVEVVSEVEKGKVTRVPQNRETLTYYSWPTKRERTLLKERLKKPRDKEDKIKNLHIITRLIKGGAQENTLQTVRKLPKERYETVLVTGPSFGPEGEIESKARDYKVDLRIIPELVRQINPVKDLIAFFKLFQLIKKGKFDIVHTHTSKAGILGRIAAKLAGVPVIIHTPHGHIFHSYFSSFKTQIFIFLEKLTALFTDRIITLTERCKEDHLALGIAPLKKFVTIPSGIEWEQFLNTRVNPLEKRKDLGFNRDELLVGTVARLVPVKGHKYLIKAAPEVIKVLPQTKFLLIGDGTLREKLKDRVAQSGLNGKVIFLGLCDDVIEILKILDLFVLSSLNEGMGRVIVEAMAVGKPVVATEVGGIPEVVVTEETGLLVSPRDSKALSEAIIRLLKDKELAKKMGEAGRKRVIPHFDIDIMVKKIEHLYEEMLKSKKIVKGEYRKESEVNGQFSFQTKIISNRSSLR